MKFLPLLVLALASCSAPLARVSAPVSSCCDYSNAKCSPTGTCTACKNCKNCGHCKAGGTCSVCKKP
ncbi:hypothetical protein OKA04_21955 [Luteolibacter flavescens]|uniref:Metallothionein n=1 Tax=Luteolibacter flavescens TaxID=1859460 RepID=A0ABT3FV36_9BACT|nr:hypothetical protein [Luteolibacter flavescens]MCW1887417.1 hypothetical protein [Luteolibacter flavescens]